MAFCTSGLDLFDSASFEGLMDDLGGGCSDGRAEAEQAREAVLCWRAFQRLLFAEGGHQHLGCSWEPFVGTQ